MNYAAHYDRLISRARVRVLTGYKERHHVIPRCMGGGDDPENLVDFTAEEHYVAHQLLVKLHPDVRGLASAAARMAKQCTGNKAFGWLRRLSVIAVSAANRGSKRSLETRAKMRAARALQVITPEACANMSVAKLGNTYCLGRTLSPDTRAKISVAKLGKTWSLEARAKMSVARRGKPWSWPRRESHERNRSQASIS